MIISSIRERKLNINNIRTGTRTRSFLQYLAELFNLSLFKVLPLCPKMKNQKNRLKVTINLKFNEQLNFSKDTRIRSRGIDNTLTYIYMHTATLWSKTYIHSYPLQATLIFSNCCQNYLFK